MANPLDPEYLKTTIRNGRSGDPGFSAAMPAFPPSKISDQDLNDLVSFVIAQNRQGSAGLGPVELARSNVFWVSITIILLVLVLWFELLLRNAAIAVLVATSPIAAAGQVSESTKSWWTKTAR